MARVFLSYSHADELHRNKLETHLAMLKRSGDIEVWHDRLLIVGDELDAEISGYLERADLIIFLVSADFLASYYCYEREMTRAMERVLQGTARVAPIIIRACDWKSAPFARYVMAPTDAKPVVEHPDIDSAFHSVVVELRRVLELLRGSAQTAPMAKMDPTFSDDDIESPRSSNLRVRQHFSEADRARYLNDSFEFISKFFNNSLSHLSQRNHDIETRFKKISDESFIAEIYRFGKHASSCKIYIGRSFFGREGAICYSSNIDAHNNSMNGSLSVDVDEHMMFLKPYIFTSFGSDDQKLSNHGAAELLWEQLVSPLQR